MTLAWPERIVLIVLATLAILAVEIGFLIVCSKYIASVWLGLAYMVAAILVDLWAALRLVDWLFAGPARRKKDRIVGFSP